jgi:hypothetical protein
LQGRVLEQKFQPTDLSVTHPQRLYEKHPQIKF